MTINDYVTSLCTYYARLFVVKSVLFLLLFFLKVCLVMLAGSSHSSCLPHVLTASFSLGLD